jgi:hypothetical protein
MLFSLCVIFLLLIAVASSVGVNNDASSILANLVNLKLPLSKLISKNRPRLLFVAGLEGTGHHAWNAMIHVCVASKHCKIAETLTKELMHFDDEENTVKGLFGTEKTQEVSLSIQGISHKPSYFGVKVCLYVAVFVAGFCCFFFIFSTH